jgi:hypothetical protein
MVLEEPEVVVVFLTGTQVVQVVVLGYMVKVLQG